MENRPDVIEDVLTPQFARRLVRRMYRQLGTETLVPDDILQEALLRGILAFRRIPDIRFPRALFGKIVRDTVISSWRKRRYEEPLTDMSGNCRPVMEESIDRSRRFERLGQALTLLAFQDREIVEMFYLNESSIPEIANRFHRSEGAIKMVLLRSRRTLRRLLL